MQTIQTTTQTEINQQASMFSTNESIAFNRIVANLQLFLLLLDLDGQHVGQRGPALVTEDGYQEGRVLGEDSYAGGYAIHVVVRYRLLSYHR